MLLLAGFALPVPRLRPLLARLARHHGYSAANTTTSNSTRAAGAPGSSPGPFSSPPGPHHPAPPPSQVRLPGAWGGEGGQALQLPRPETVSRRCPAASLGCCDGQPGRRAPRAPRLRTCKVQDGGCARVPSDRPLDSPLMDNIVLGLWRAPWKAEGMKPLGPQMPRK